MVWDINQINSAFMNNLPNYGGQFQAGVDENRARQALQLQAQQAQEDRARQLAQQQQLEAARQAALSRPSPQTFAALAVLDPKQSEGYKRAFDTLDTDQRQTTLRTLSDAHNYLENGFTDRAKAVLQQRIDADKAAGQDTSQEEGFLQAIDENPTNAAAVLKHTLWSLVPDEQKPALFKNVGDAAREDAKLPGEIAKTQAEADKARVEADMAPQVIESDLASEQATREKQAADIANQIGQLEVSRGRLSLDRERVAADVMIRTNEIQQKYGQLKPPEQKLVNDAVASAGVNYGLANRAKDLADQFQVADVGSGGWRSSFAEKFKGVWGTQNALTGLRNSYDQLVNSQAVKNLPPGPASDKDIQLAKQGFPASTADKTHIISFLRGMEKMQRLAGEADDRRADWVGANGGLGAARQDMEVDGYLVKKGTKFNQFNQAIGALGKGPPAGVEAIAQKYAR